MPARDISRRWRVKFSSSSSSCCSCCPDEPVWQCQYGSANQGSGTRVCSQKARGFFWVHHLKTPPPKNPHFYFNLILVYTLYATNNAIFYCSKAFKALSYRVFVLFYLFFMLVQKKTPKPTGLGF